MAADMDAATVLEEAADLLLMRGRCRVESYITVDGEDRYCVLGAIAKVLEADDLDEWADADSPTTTHPATRALASHLATRYPALVNVSATSAIYLWNDGSPGYRLPEVDDFEVIDTLRHVAKDIRNGEVVV